MEIFKGKGGKIPFVLLKIKLLKTRIQARMSENQQQRRTRGQKKEIKPE